jgi:hypothetical protein
MVVRFYKVTINRAGEGVAYWPIYRGELVLPCPTVHNIFFNSHNLYDNPAVIIDTYAVKASLPTIVLSPVKRYGEHSLAAYWNNLLMIYLTI